MKIKTTRSKRKKKMAWTGIIIGSVSTFLGAMGAAFSVLGVCLFCLTPLVGLLGVFGLSVGILADYNLYFIIPGIMLISSGAVLFWRRRKCNECETE